MSTLLLLAAGIVVLTMLAMIGWGWVIEEIVAEDDGRDAN